MTVDDTTREFGRGIARIGLVVDLLRLATLEAVDDMTPLLHPEMKMIAAPGIAPSRPYETREDFIAYFAEARALGVLVEPDACSIRVNSAGAVIVTGTVRITTAQSVDDAPAWFVYTFRDGLIASLETYLDGALADEAANAGPTG